MTHLTSLTTPTDVDLLVAFCDLTQYARYAQGRSSREVFAFLSDYYEFLGDIIEPAGGTIVKFMGDAALMAFEEDRAEDGVLALLKLKMEGDAWTRDRGTPCRHIIKAHYGLVTCGPVGTRGEKRFDVFGVTVNTAALIPSRGLAFSAQVFRRLSKEARQHFKKHTPPVTYIPVDAPHRD